MLPILQSAITDMQGAIARRRVWIVLASEDISDQHRRTTLGPFWLLINYLCFAATFIFIFHAGPLDRSYAIYVATGSWIWFYIMEIITLGTSVFVREESFIKGTNLPLSVYVMRATLQSVIRAAYGLIGCVLVLILMQAPVTIVWLWSILGIAIVVAVTPAVLAVFGFLGVYFPDSQYVITNLMRVAMFATPVFWQINAASEGGLRGILYHWNPLTYFLEIVRTPVTDGSVPVRAFVICVIVAVSFWALAIGLLGALRRQVALAI